MNALVRFFAPRPAASPLTDPDEVDRVYRRFRWSVIITLTLTYGMAYTCRLGLSVVKKPLIDQGVFTALELGVIGAAYKWSYGAGKLFNGFIADRVNIKAFIPAGLAVSALLNLVMGNNILFALGVVVWALNGWFQGFGAPASAVSITQWFSRRERGTAYGIWSAAHAIGEGLTFSVTAWLVAHTVWNSAFVVPGVACFVVAVLAYRGLKDRPAAYGLPLVNDYKGESVSVDTQAVSAPQFKDQLSILKLPAVWIICLSSAAMYVTRYAINDWGVLYLQEEHGFSTVKAGTFIAINTVAGIFGSGVYGWISDRFFDARRPPVTLVFGLCEIVGLWLIFSDLGKDPVWLGLGYAIYGFTLSGILAVLGGLFAVDLSPKNAAGTAMGVVGIFSYVGAGLQDVVSGYLIEAHSTLVDGVRVYDFTVPVAFWVGASVLSMVLAATLWNARAPD